MSNLDDPTALVSLEGVLSYRSGVPPESADFDFLLGTWDARTTRWRADGSEIASYGGTWSARHLHDRRILLDEFTARLDDGSELSYMATLRTWCPAARRWQMTFLIAHEPPLVTSFSGTWDGTQMMLDGSGRTLAGDPVLVKVRFFDLTPSSFEWDSTVSLDGGASWYRDSTISARR